MDEGLLHDLCSRARRVQDAHGTEASLRGLTELVRAAADPRGRRSDVDLHQLIETAPLPGPLGVAKNVFDQVIRRWF